MFKTLRDFWDRVSTRRKLQRKGLVVSRRRFDSEKLLGALEGSPAPGIFMLVMIWTVSAVLLTISAQQHIEGVLNLVVGQQAPRTIIATLDFSYQDAEGTELEVRQAMEKIPLYFRIDAKSNNTIRRNFSTLFEAVGRRLADEKAGKKFIPAARQSAGSAGGRGIAAAGDRARGFHALPERLQGVQHAPEPDSGPRHSEPEPPGCAEGEPDAAGHRPGAAQVAREERDRAGRPACGGRQARRRNPAYLRRRRPGTARCGAGEDAARADRRRGQSSLPTRNFIRRSGGSPPTRSNR